VPLFDADDRLPARPRRVLVAGTSGAGKTTLADQIAGALRIRHVEIDSLCHGGSRRPREDFVADVRRLAGQDAWVTEWQYDAARPLLAERADTLVWLDLPKGVVMRQVTRRTVCHRLRREELWHGNVEPPLRTLLTDRDHIVRWAWNTHHLTAVRVRGLLTERPDVNVVRLRNRSDVARWTAGPLALSAGP
jgi:adenylate kinase family enzyme